MNNALYNCSILSQVSGMQFLKVLEDHNIFFDDVTGTPGMIPVRTGTVHVPVLWCYYLLYLTKK